MATIEIPDYLLEAAKTTSEELSAELAILTPQEAVEHLQKVSRAAEEFLLFMVCELRTPVTAMLGYTDILLLSDHRLTPDKQKYLITAIRENAQRLFREIDAAYDIFRYENGTLTLQVGEVDLNDLINKVISEISEQVNFSYERADSERHKLVKPQFVYTVPDKIPKISVDERRIYRILIEILSEAIRIYNRKSNSEIVFTVSYDESWVTMKIGDDGIGLPSHLDEQIPSLNPTNQHIIEMHGGNFEVEKSGSGGWIVKLILPVCQNEASQ